MAEKLSEDNPEMATKGNLPMADQVLALLLFHHCFLGLTWLMVDCFSVMQTVLGDKLASLRNPGLWGAV